MRSLLIRCYPARWRERYGDEFLAILEEGPLGPYDVADILLGALDARLRSRWDRAARSSERGLSMSLRVGGIAAIVGAVILAFSWFGTIFGAIPVDGRALAALIVVGLASLLVALTILSAFQARVLPRLVWTAFGLWVVGARDRGHPPRSTSDRGQTCLTKGKDRTVTHSLAIFPTVLSRLLGAAGILGGTVLLAAFVLEIPGGLNDVRLALFNIGAIAVVIAVHRRQVAVSPNLARIVAIATIAANLMYLMRAVVLPNGPWHPFAGDHGWVLFYAGSAMWLAEAAFGFVTLRLGAVTRWGALALTIGSLLAVFGMDRLELTSQANPTIFGPISLIGIALNGIAWILLGLDVMLGGSPAVRLRSARSASGLHRRARPSAPRRPWSA